MQVRLVRLADDPCEPACTEWISAAGRIDATTPGEFRKVLTKLGTRKVPVLIDSGGGVVDAGFSIGRMLRAKGLDVVVTKTAFQPCKLGAVECHKLKLKGIELGRPEAKISKCASSCAFVLAGGVRRYVGPWTVVGLHEMKVIATHRQVLRQFLVERRMINGVPVEVKRTLVKEHTIATRKEEREADEKLYEKARAYFAEMGIAESVMPIMRSAPHTSIRLLRPAELRSTALATDFVNGEQLLMPQAATAAVAAVAGNAPVAPAPSGLATSAQGNPLITGSIGTPSAAAPAIKPETHSATAKLCTLSPGVAVQCGGTTGTTPASAGPAVSPSAAPAPATAATPLPATNARVQTPASTPSAISPAPVPAAATLAPPKPAIAPATVLPSLTAATDKPDGAVVSVPASAPPAPLPSALSPSLPASAAAASPSVQKEAPAEPAAKAPAAKKARADAATRPAAKSRATTSDGASPAFAGN